MDLALVDYDPSVVGKEEIMRIFKKTGYEVISVATAMNLLDRLL